MFQNLFKAAIFFSTASVANAQQIDFDIDLRTGQICASEAMCINAPTMNVEVEYRLQSGGAIVEINATSENLTAMVPLIENQTGMEVLRGPTFRSDGDRFIIGMRLDPHNIINPRDTRIELVIRDRTSSPTVNYRGRPSAEGLECPTGSYPSYYLPPIEVTSPNLAMSLVIDDVPGFTGIERDARNKIAGSSTHRLYHLFANLETLGADVKNLELEPVSSEEFRIGFQISVAQGRMSEFLENLGFALGMDQSFTLLGMIRMAMDGSANNNEVLQRFLLKAIQESPNWSIHPGNPNWSCVTEGGFGDGPSQRVLIP